MPHLHKALSLCVIFNCNMTPSPMTKMRILRVSIFIFFLTYSICYGQVKVEAYVIPKNYRGKVVVVFNRPFGHDSKISNDTLFYYIPPDGIAIVSNIIRTAIAKSCFITSDSSGKKTNLTIHSKDDFYKSTDSTNKKNEIGIIIFGTIGSCIPNAKSNFCYTDFYTGTFNEMPDYYTPDKAKEFSARLSKKAKWNR